MPNIVFFQTTKFTDVYAQDGTVVEDTEPQYGYRVWDNYGLDWSMKGKEWVQTITIHPDSFRST